MGSFHQYPWSQARFSRYYRRTVANPFLYFGLPFISTIVLGSFALTPLAKTRYELHDMKTGPVVNEDELTVRLNKRPISLQEEYWRLQEKDLDDWSIKRVARPPGGDEE
ncbi:Cytochrome oxidase assembly [Dimargaris verticillata]|uniref:Cytochrome c oxidase assembly protein COX16, mitochondrial n=1 Tax=Dimargaris verticillata TaxID=2761393 RepID=A0A9W8BA40_9FUNG|nr:Cytochrome oxidase assembly [Dimargaris verticillata]